MKFPFHPNFQSIEHEIQTLLSKTPYKVGVFVDEKEYMKYPKHGIYAFTDPDDKELVYIGILAIEWTPWRIWSRTTGL
jgi:hypothetical protein